MYIFIRDIIRRMIVLDPAERWTCEQLLQHKWFSDNEEELYSHDISKTVAELRRHQVKINGGMDH